MTIVALFEHKGQTVIVCDVEGLISQPVKEVRIRKQKYFVLEQEIMHSLSGQVAIGMKLNTNKTFTIGEEVFT